MFYFLEALMADSANITLSFLPNAVDLLIGTQQAINVTASKPLVEDAWINFTYESGGSEGGRILVDPIPPMFWPANLTFFTIFLHAVSGGHMYLGIISNSLQFIDLSNVYLSLHTFHVSWLQTFSDVIGWIYFSAWTISFWPQVVLNFYRKSVVGLNFDFLTFNMIGFSCYATFNCVFYFSPVVQKQYFDENPRGSLPVTLQDVCFAVHAVAVIMLTIFQTLIFERGQQRVSWVCRIISSAAIVFIIVSLTIGGCGVISWLMVITFLSYVKLGSTLIKYIPQAYMNFKRKSTVGWSIWNVLLDFTGGISSILQMFVLAYNFDDWASIMGNPTKFALGTFSVLFDVLFIVQHYCLYRNAADDARDVNINGNICSCCCPGSPPENERPFVTNPSDASMGGQAYSQVVAEENENSAQPINP